MQKSCIAGLTHGAQRWGWYVVEELGEGRGTEKGRKVYRNKRKNKLGTKRRAEVVCDLAETVKTPTSGSHQPASVKCKTDMR